MKQALPLTLEAVRISQYLVGKKPTQQECELYIRAHEILAIHLTPEENKIWNFTIHHPIIMGPIDAALAFKNPEGEIRRKLMVMMAILETGGKNNAQFLPIGFSPFYLLKIIFSGIRSVIRLLVGLIILPWL